jgi:hypothetical protein
MDNQKPISLSSEINLNIFKFKCIYHNKSVHLRLNLVKFPKYIQFLLRTLQVTIYCISNLFVVKYKIHLYSLRNRPEKLAEGSLFCLFLKLVQINFIFTDNVRYTYIVVKYKIHLYSLRNRPEKLAESSYK